MCNRCKVGGTKCRLEVEEYRFCALVDAGSQISLIKESIVQQLIPLGKITLRSLPDYSTVKAIDGSIMELSSYLEVECCLSASKLVKRVPFAIVPDEALPCCALVGTNFLEANNMVMDYRSNCLIFETEEGTVRYVLSDSNPDVNCAHVLNTSIAYEMLNVDEEIATAEDFESGPQVKFLISNDNIKGIQSSDFTINKLRALVRNKIPRKRWKRTCLK